MSTIVTLNRGGQDAPFYQSSAGDFNGVASFSTDFLTDPGFASTDFGLVTGAGGVYGNTDGSDVSSFNSAIFAYADSAGKDFSFAVRAKFSARNNGDIASFGLASAFGAHLPTQAANVSFKVTQRAAAAADAIVCSFDDGTTESEVTLTNPSGFDSEAYHIFGAHVSYDGTTTTARFYIDGVEVRKTTSAGVFSAAEAMAFGGHQAAETALLYMDWAGAACTVRS